MWALPVTEAAQAGCDGFLMWALPVTEAAQAGCDGEGKNGRKKPPAGGRARPQIRLFTEKAKRGILTPWALPKTKQLYKSAEL